MKPAQNAYFVHGSRIYHPTKTNSFIANKSTINDTYVAESKVKVYPSFYDFGPDNSTMQNDTDESSYRRYFFPPFTS